MNEPDKHEDLEIGRVLEAIHGKYGYDFRGYSKDSIRRRLRAALAKSGACHLSELRARVLADRLFLGALIDDLTVQVSDLFRDPEFFRAFRTRVVPRLRTYPRLNVWHAGCASGEEVYALAILLSEEGLYDRSQIYATDVSESAVERAREGIYARSELATFMSQYTHAGGTRKFEDYYSCAYERMAFKPALRRNIAFFQHDLVQDYAFGEMHVIFCRNVLIYFTASLRKRVLGTFADSLCRGGFLCLGMSEYLPEDPGAFLSFLPLERIYRHQGQP